MLFRSLDPGNTNTMLRISSLEATLGHFEKALEYDRRALRLDPVNPSRFNSMASHLVAIDSVEKGIQFYRRGEELDKLRPVTCTFMGIAYIRLGKFDEAEVLIGKETIPSWQLYGKALLEYAKGNPKESAKMLKELKDLRGAIMAFQIAGVHAFRHEADSAFHWLNTGIQTNDVGMTLLKTDRMFDILKGDPRWNDILAKMKFQKE